jgi:hypothetical protein
MYTGRLPVNRTITGRPAGPVRSDFFRPVPVPVMKNSDRFHLCYNNSNNNKIHFFYDDHYLQVSHDVNNYEHFIATAITFFLNT